MIAEDGEMHLANVSRSLLLSSSPQQALVVVGDNVVGKGNVVRSILDVDQAVVPIDLPAPDELVRGHGRGAVFENVAVDPHEVASHNADGVVSRVPAVRVRLRRREAVAGRRQAQVSDDDVGPDIEDQRDAIQICVRVPADQCEVSLDVDGFPKLLHVLRRTPPALEFRMVNRFFILPRIMLAHILSVQE